MAEYKIYLYNTLTRLVTATVPASSLSYGYKMDDAGSAMIEIPMGVPKLDGSALTPGDLFPVRTGVVVSRDGVLVWGGLLWAYKADLTKRTLSLSASGYLSYYAHRMTNYNGVRFDNIEQTAMIKNLITAATSGIQTDTAGLVPTNTVRSRSWNPYEMKPLASVFADLADDITTIDPQSGREGGGFFLYFDPYWITPGVSIGNRVYNTVNRHPYDSGASLQQGVNCEFTDFSLDGTTLVSAAFAIGATDGTASLTPFAVDTNPSLLSTTPQISAVLTENGIKQTTALQYKARSALAFGSAPVIVPTAVTYPNQFSPLSLKPGMSAGVTTDDGFLNLIDADYVITETTVSVASDGSDRIALTLVQADLFKETAD
ncbi:hypothetical protein [Kitasatospora griseola]|nr:hypothetical protein [Kitasatospora griseola]